MWGQRHVDDRALARLHPPRATARGLGCALGLHDVNPHAAHAVLDRRLGHVQHPLHVQPPHRAPALGGYALGGGEVLAARVVYEDVQPAAPLDHRLDQPLASAGSRTSAATQSAGPLPSAPSVPAPAVMSSAQPTPAPISRTCLVAASSVSARRPAIVTARAAPRELDRGRLAQPRPAARHERHLAAQQPLSEYLLNARCLPYPRSYERGRSVAPQARALDRGGTRGAAADRARPRRLPVRAPSHRQHLPPPRPLHPPALPHPARARTRTLRLAVLRLLPRAHPLLPRARRACSRRSGACGSATATRCSSFPPRSTATTSSSSPTTACSARSTSTPATPSGSAASARSPHRPPRPSATSSTPPSSRARTASARAKSSRSPTPPAGSSGAAHCPAPASPRRCSTTACCSSAPNPAPSTH